jgi:hypothetical protein
MKRKERYKKGKEERKRNNKRKKEKAIRRKAVKKGENKKTEISATFLKCCLFIRTAVTMNYGLCLSSGILKKLHNTTFRKMNLTSPSGAVFV